MMLASQSAMMACAALLALLTLTGHDSVLSIYAVVVALACAQTFDNPARQSMVPHLVPRADVSNAISLNTITWQLGTVIGPGVAGVLIAAFGVTIVYAIDAVSYLAVIGALLAIRYRGQRAIAGGVSLAAIREGLQFTVSRKIVWSTMVLDFLATFFASARTMLPLFATRAAGGGVLTFGALATAQPVGGLIAGLACASRPPMRGQGRILLGSVAVYGIATALFGLTTHIVPAYVLFAITGAGDMVSTVIRGTIRQLETPDHLRGRVTSVNMLFFMGGPQLGEVEAGAVAARFGVRAAIFTGGLATVALVPLTRVLYPSLATYDAPPQDEVELA
jgi:MFS family permease